MKKTFKEFLMETNTGNLATLAKKIGISIKDLKTMDNDEIRIILKDIGNHDFVPISKFDQAELKMGIDAELEHSNSILIATLIAKDHLMELPDYYSRLKKMERD